MPHVEVTNSHYQIGSLNVYKVNENGIKISVFDFGALFIFF